MRSSYIVLKLIFAFKPGCSSLGFILDIIAFLPCLTREDCSFLRLLLLVSDLGVPLNHSSSPVSASERSEVPGFSITLLVQSRHRALADPPIGGGRVGLASVSFSRRVPLVSRSLLRPRRFALHRHQDSSHFLVSFRSLKHHDILHSLLHQEKLRNCC